jgi:sarcosine oxidase
MTSPDAVSRDVGPVEIAQMYESFVRPYLKNVLPNTVKAKACLYTVTPDAGFILDHLPQSERIIVASCCSGHGFKHSAAIGEVLADMAQNRPTPLDISPFRLARFSA